MPNTLKAFLLIPLILLTSCATGPKLTPEMETLRLSLNQRMANNSSIQLTASVMQMPKGKVVESLSKKERAATTTIQPNGDVIIDFRLVTSYGQNKKSLSHLQTEFGTLKLKANLLKTAWVSFSDFEIKNQFGYEDYQHAHIGNAYRCLLCTPDTDSYTVVKSYVVPSFGIEGLRLSFEPIAASPDKAFIQGIVRDMKRFIELYKALPK